MDIWADVERRIRERGVRVEERLALLSRLREPDAAEQLEARGDALLQQVKVTLKHLRTEAIHG